MQVLDKGFVELIDHMGSDLSVVNGARISMGKRKEVFDDKDAGLINYLAAHDHSCYDQDTEVFTSTGWKRWDSVTYDDMLAAVDADGGMRFERPISIHSSHYSGKMVRFKHAHIDALVTPDHRMWASRWNLKHDNGYRFVDAIECLGTRVRFRTEATLRDGVGGDYCEGWLYGFFIGDGSVPSENTIVFRLKKSRKIESLRHNLDSIGIGYRITYEKSRPDVATIRIYNPNKLLFKGKALNKRIDERVFGMSLDFRRGVWDGLMDSDGSRKRASWLYSTASDGLATDVVRLGTTVGINCRENKQLGTHRISVLTRSTEPRINDYRDCVTVEDYNGMIYCASVSTGLLMVRRNGRQMVCGNSPFRIPHVVIHIKAPIFVMRQWMRYKIGSDFDEISGRYVEFEPEYYIPEVFRTQSKDVKQGSDGELEWSENTLARMEYENGCIRAFMSYEGLLEMGVAKEQARMVLPLALYTEVYWTASLQAVAHFLNQRLDSHAQWEIREYAKAVKELVLPLYPHSLNALLEAE